jgi:hypothetical protein
MLVSSMILTGCVDTVSCFNTLSLVRSAQRAECHRRSFI